MTDLAPATARLIAAEHLLSRHLPDMTTRDRLGLVIQIRGLLDGTTEIEKEVA